MSDNPSEDVQERETRDTAAPASPDPSTSEAREYEIVVWGASGFTGRLVVEYLLGRHGVGQGLRWALGGRSREKLEKVRDALSAESGVDASGLELLVGDAHDERFVRELAERSAVVCSTVGPYALYGSELVAACAERGAHYCDLTGEIHWMQAMLEAHQDAARASGARLLHTCGFDSIPSDLGTYFVQRTMQERHGVTSPRVSCRVVGFSGGASGGTIASMLEMMEAAERDPEVARAADDPYALNPKDQRMGPDGPDRSTPRFDPEFGQWLAPFVMASLNSRVVRRSNALLGYAYGRDFRYDEAMLMGKGPLGLAKASGVAAGSVSLMRAMGIGPLRRRVAPFLPSPGDGPSKEKREAGYFDLRFLAAHPDDPKLAVRARVQGDRDPGYGSTAKMLGETALALARDPVSVEGGFWTPASALGSGLIDRLHEHAGVTFEIES